MGNPSLIEMVVAFLLVLGPLILLHELGHFLAAKRGGIRALEIPASGMVAAKKIVPQGYLTQANPGPFFVGVDHPMGVYTWDSMIFTNAKVKEDVKGQVNLKVMEKA